MFSSCLKASHRIWLHFSEFKKPIVWKWSFYGNEKWMAQARSLAWPPYCTFPICGFIDHCRCWPIQNGPPIPPLNTVTAAQCFQYSYFCWREKNSATSWTSRTFALGTDAYKEEKTRNAAACILSGGKSFPATLYGRRKTSEVSPWRHQQTEAGRATGIVCSIVFRVSFRPVSIRFRVSPRTPRFSLHPGIRFLFTSGQPRDVLSRRNEPRFLQHTRLSVRQELGKKTCKLQRMGE